VLWNKLNIFLLNKIKNLLFNNPEFDFDNFRNKNINFYYLRFEFKYNNIILSSFILSLITFFNLGFITSNFPHHSN